MGYEVDFLPVGDGERSGDAIALRYGNLYGKRNEQRVVIVDGGFMETGEKLVDHVHTYYETNYVDLVVSSHPDNDHSTGLQVVLDEMEIGMLWMHKPWEHTQDIAKMFEDGRVTDMSIKETLRKSLESARELERIAKAKRIPIIEPLTGVRDDNGVFVIGPSKEYYESLLPDFRCTPEPKYTSLIETILRGTKKFLAQVAESWNIETLGDDGETSAENNSSTILVVAPGNGDYLMFTADAGIPALTMAADTLDSISFEYSNIKLIQIPHHGSRRNVGPSILNRIIGPKQQTDKMLRTACISASKDGAPKHPAKKVTNAFRRRGAWVHGTMDGNTIRHHRDAPSRDGWTAAEPVPFYAVVEESESEAA